jgi:hypothetical protein
MNRDARTMQRFSEPSTHLNVDRSRSGNAYWVLSQLPLCSPT